MTAAPKAVFSRRVYAMVRRIPPGSVATYGQIAASVGHPGAARAVGTALARLPRHLQSAVPWHRVVASGGVSRQRSPDGAMLQRELLLDEGVEVGGSGRIDVPRFQWSGARRSLPAAGVKARR